MNMFQNFLLLHNSFIFGGSFIPMIPLIFHPHLPFKTKQNLTTCSKRNLVSVFVLISPCFFASGPLPSLQVNLALKQKSDIEHYRNKLRLKAKRKGYYDFPSTDGSSSGRALAQRQRHSHERAAGEHGRPLEPDDERGSTYVKSHRRWGESGKASGTWVLAECKQKHTWGCDDTVRAIHIGWLGF